MTDIITFLLAVFVILILFYPEPPYPPRFFAVNPVNINVGGAYYMEIIN